MHKFHPGDPFPCLSGESVRHGRIALPDAIPAERWGVILAYRAHW
jgi:hypothetical protein